MAASFLDITGFTARFGVLTSGQTLVATDVLQVVSDWIRGQKPDVDTTAAAQVVFEVTRDQINLGQYAPLASFQNQTSRRMEAGELKDTDDLIAEVLSPRQKRLLGISLRAAPAYNFPVCVPSPLNPFLND